MFRGFWTIFVKEVIDNLRDRRTLTTMGVSIVVGPLFMFGFLWFAAARCVHLHRDRIKQISDLCSGRSSRRSQLRRSSVQGDHEW